MQGLVALDTLLHLGAALAVIPVLLLLAAIIQGILDERLSGRLLVVSLQSEEGGAR